MRGGEIAAAGSVALHVALLGALLSSEAPQVSVPQETRLGVEVVAAPPRPDPDPPNRQQATGDRQQAMDPEEKRETRRPQKRSPRAAVPDPSFPVPCCLFPVPCSACDARPQSAPPSVLPEATAENAPKGLPPAAAGVGGHLSRGSDSARAPDPEVIRAAVQRTVKYPRLAQAQGMTGRVVVRFRIDDSGNPAEVSIVTSASAILDAAARDAVLRAGPFREPPGWVRVPVDFSLRPQF
jgi:periplasmic protein TonB